MKSLATAFKEVYGEALKEYGFKKVKSKYPYYARMVGDEIVQVITCATEWCGTKTKKAFTILGGVATVYRRKIILDVSPKDNDWLIANYNVSECLYGFDPKGKSELGIIEFVYDKDDEESLLEALRYSWKVTEENLLASLNKVNSLSDCIDFFTCCPLANMSVNIDNILCNENVGCSNEGLINIIYYGLEKIEGYVKRVTEGYEKANAVLRHNMDVGKCGFSEEDFKKDKIAREKRMLEQIKRYEMIVTNIFYMSKVKAEAERRKTRNVEILKIYELI